MDFFHCIPLEEAEPIIWESLAGSSPPQETVHLGQAAGRIIAADMVSTEYIPSFSRSTVDGFAVRSSDTFGAGEGVPASLILAGEIHMGQASSQQLLPGQAAPIPTGAMLPPGADAVVMLEQAETVDDETILILKAVAPGDNVIRKGEDLAPGQIIINRGQKLGAADIGALAACGFAAVSVYGSLNVGIISTGDEIVDADAALQPGQIRDINSYALAAAVTEKGHRPIRYGIIPDEYDKLLACLTQAAAECHLVLVSGGSSVGARDHTVRVLEDLGGRKVMIHGLAIKPGKPTIFGMVGTVPVFGLPGHPVSALTIFDKLVTGALDRMAGAVPRRCPFVIPAVISRNVASAPGRDDFIRVRLTPAGPDYVAEPVFGKSGLISTLVQADGLVRIPTESSGLYAGDRVMVELFRSRQ